MRRVFLSLLAQSQFSLEVIVEAMSTHLVEGKLHPFNKMECNGIFQSATASV